MFGKSKKKTRLSVGFIDAGDKKDSGQAGITHQEYESIFCHSRKHRASGILLEGLDSTRN
ncbi:MAG: hypothetical protein A2Y81_03065 [Nitrospirae bacterium RBG_13_43_8]|nr:MAG: hypothetical protein A2Y81_03065 [Nitrospirae bacterium RBG_13_43_8]